MEKIKVCFLPENKEIFSVHDRIKGVLKKLIENELGNEVKIISNCNKKETVQEKIIFVIPLFSYEEPYIEARGIYELVNYYLHSNKNNTQFHSIFIVMNTTQIPDVFHPERKMPYYVEKLLHNPQFGEVEKAVLMAELVYEEIQGEKKVINMIDILREDFDEKFIKAIRKLKKKDLPAKYKQEFYNTFIGFYYDDFCEWNNKKYKFEIKEDINIDDNTIINSACLEKANKLYNKINGILIQGDHHRVPLELFRAPLPFLLQELWDAREEIKKALRGHRLRLLLIDNRYEKFIKDEEEGAICGLIDEFELQDLFRIEMIGKEEYVDKTIHWQEGKFYLDNVEVEIEKIDRQKIFFDFNEFKVDRNYPDKVYKKIKENSFILLDFFLNDQNIYFAFDFIRDINKIKKKRNDFSTTWYFITSAVYDAVVQYTQSGLLAESYKLAVVNSGDDPCNEKRKIIFIYKLLIFIHARLKSFKTCGGVIRDWFNKCNQNKTIDKDQCENCLREIISLAQIYLAEYDEIKKIFPGLEDEEFKIVTIYLRNLIKDFFWLPEADWQIIQLQKEMIDKKLRESSVDKNFSCPYIEKELKKRSEIY